MKNSSRSQLQLFKPSKYEQELSVLEFLSVESWSNEFNLADLLQISPRGLGGVLKPMIINKLIKSVDQKIMGGSVKLLGITSLGQKKLRLSAYKPSDFEMPNTELNLQIVSLSRISPTFIPHRLDIQMLKIRAERAGWTNWVNADTGEDRKKGSSQHLRLALSAPVLEHRPDAWCTDPSGNRLSIECERTIKSKPRYSEIVRDYLLALKRGDIDRVLWVSPDQDLRDRLAYLITSITHVQIGVQKLLIPRVRFERFDYLTFEQWPV